MPDCISTQLIEWIPSCIDCYTTCYCQLQPNIVLHQTGDNCATILMYFRDVLPTVHCVDKTREIKSQAICMNPAICNVCVCPYLAKLLFFQVCLLRTFLILLVCSTFLLRLLGYSTSAQGVFEIQVKIFDPPLVGIATNLSLTNEDIKEYTIQVPPSMTLLQNVPLSDISSPCMDSNQRCPSKGV